jgi:hypothetical protein
MVVPLATGVSGNDDYQRACGRRETPLQGTDSFGLLPNNHAKRAIRPAVMIGKNSFGNRSERGADAQAVLMSVYRTLQQRGHAPLKTIVDALGTYLVTGKLPPLPAKVAAIG